MLFLCRNGDTWEARTVKPKKCPKCGSRHVYNIDIHAFNFSSLRIQLLNGTNAIIREARVSNWDLPRVLHHFREDAPGSKIKVYQDDELAAVSGRMGMAVQRHTRIGNIVLHPADERVTDDIQVEGHPVRLSYTLKDTTTISTRIKPRDRAKRDGEWIQEYSGLVYEVFFVFPGFTEAITRNDEQYITTTCLRPLETFFTRARAVILFVELPYGTWNRFPLE
ncbi:MAG: hypothetical protein ACFFD4_26735 [Candidatus Odinarchaeota archaeon]